nr:hypothetical protein [Tanacetum cinerariifolium]
MFTDEQPPDYSFPPRFDVYHDDFLEIESDATFDDDSFDSEGEKIKEAELLIDQLDLPCDILSEYDSFNSQNFPGMMFCPLLIMRTRGALHYHCAVNSPPILYSNSHPFLENIDSPKKSRGKGLQRNKTADDSHETIDVSKESEPKLEPVKRKTASRRVVKKKVIIFVDDNIIHDPDVALELGKSISLAKAEEEEAAKQVHATHARIVTEFVPESAKKKTGSKSSKPKLKGVQSLTPVEKEAANIMHALKESKKSSKRQPGTGGLSEGTSTIPGVLYESTIVSTTSSEGTGTKPGVLDEEYVITKENVILEWGSEQERKYSEEDQLNDEEKDDKEGDADDEGDDHISDTEDTDDEDDETESDEDEIYKYKIRVRKDEEQEMLNAEVEYFGKGDAEVSDTAKADAEKTEETKDYSKKAKLHPISSSLSISLSSGDQFLKLSFDTSLVGTSPSVLRVPVSVISKPTILTPIQETPSAAPVITLPLPSVSTTPPVPQQKTTPIPTPPIITDALIITYVVPESDAISPVQLRVAKLEKGCTPTVDLEQESKKSPSEILKIKKEQAEKQKMPKFTIKSTDKAALKEFDQKSSLYQTMHANKSFNKTLANHRLYHALMETLIEDENAIDKGVADTVKDHKRNHDDDEDDDDEDPPAGSNQGKAPSKGSKTGKSAFAKEPVEEPTAQVVMDDASEDVPQFNQTVSASRDPLTFNNFMATQIDFSKTYTTSITKTKAARYKIEGIEDMVPTLWSPTKVGYDKDALKGNIGMKGVKYGTDLS